MTVVMPPFQVQDEATHWKVALNRVDAFRGPSTGAPSVGRCLPEHFRWREVAFLLKHVPRSAYSDLDQVSTSDCQDSWAPYGTVLTYPGVILATLVSKLTGLRETGWRALIVFLLSRLFQGLLITTVLFRLAFHSSRQHRHLTPGLLTILAFCLTPLFVKQSFGVSSDSVCFAFSLCVIGLIYFGEYLTRFDHLLFAFCGIAAATTKPMVLCLYAFGIVLCAPSYGAALSRRNFRFHLISFTVLTLLGLTFSVWDLSYLYYDTIPEGYKLLGVPEGVSTSGQAAWMLRNKVEAISTIVAGFNYMLLNQVNGAMSFGYPKLYDQPSTYTLWCWWLLFSLASLLDIVLCLLKRRDSPLHSHVKAFLTPLILIAAGVSFGLATSLAQYLRTTVIGSSEVRDLQIRYLFPGSIFLLASIQLGLFLNSRRLLPPLLHSLRDRYKTSIGQEGRNSVCETREGRDKKPLLYPLRHRANFLCITLTLGVLVVYSASLLFDVVNRYW